MASVIMLVPVYLPKIPQFVCIWATRAMALVTLVVKAGPWPTSGLELRATDRKSKATARKSRAVDPTVALNGQHVAFSGP